MKNPLIVGSRDSELALTQTQLVIEALKGRYPELGIELKTYKTQGDLILETALSKIGDKGLFVKELEYALMDGEIDFAVHSMKDMPSEQPEGLHLFPFGKREKPLDAFISKSRFPFWDIPQGAVIGTSSLRRVSVLKHYRPDLFFQNIRGNIHTRLRKLEEGPYDAIILASAGIHRMQLEDLIVHTFPEDMLIPACCQGTLAVEIKDMSLLEVFQPFLHEETIIATRAERAFLKTLQGGCQIPMAAYARREENNVYRINAMVCDPEGTDYIYSERLFLSEEAKVAGEGVALAVLNQGGREILKNLLHGDIQLPIQHP